MADRPAGEQSEAPTQRRREEAHREGRVAKSQELSSAAVMLAGVGALAFAGGRSIAAFVSELLGDSARWITAPPLTVDTASELVAALAGRTMTALSPFFFILAGIVLAVDVIQARGVFSTERIAVKWSHLNPLEGVQRLVNAEAFFNLLKSVVKLSALAAVAYLAFARNWTELLSLSDVSASSLADAMRRMGVGLAISTGLAFLAIAGADYLFQFWRFEGSLKMTRQEVVQEYKETEGDPLIKSRIRAMARALSRRKMLRQVATADVVLTNPTRLAVALKYDVAVAAAPIVVAMGARKLADRIRAIARESGIPILEQKPLAQALFATARIGEPIPSALYFAVAEVLAFVYRQRDRARGRTARRAGVAA